MMNPVHEILIVKYLSGEASPEEAILVDEWINTSPENKEQFMAWMQAWNASGHDRYNEASREQAWSATQALIAREQPAKRNLFYFYWMAAAVVILICVLAIFLPRNKQPLVKEEMIRFEAGRQAAGTVRLTDSSVVTLNRNGALVYPRLFAAAERKVQLKGEGFFRISANPQHPFIIQAGPVNIRVVGTSFNVQQTDSSVVTQVHDGVVEMYNAHGKLQLSPRQSGIYRVATGTFLLQQLFSRNDAAFATHIFDFDNVALPKVLQTISNTYHVKIVLKNHALHQLRLTAQFDNKPLPYILEVIASTFKIKYSIGEDDTYYFE